MIDWLIKRAERTPYFHLDGYMLRWWLVPYRRVIERMVRERVKPITLFDGVTIFEEQWVARVVTDGTGPVAFRERPLAWLLQRLDIAVRVHDILRSDTGRNPHDHPWPYLTIILKGGYYELRYDAAGNHLSTKWHGPGSVLFRRANSWHRLVLPEGETATTLFITGKKAQTWGFNVNGVKVPYWEYKS